MWTVIYIAPNQVKADEIKDALTDEGVMVSLRATGGCDNGVEIKVPSTEVKEAHQILNQTLGRRWS